MKPIVSLYQYGKRKGCLLALSLALAVGVAAGQVVNSEAQDSKTESRVTVHTEAASKPENKDSNTVANKLRGSASKFSESASMFAPWWNSIRQAPEAAWMLRNLDDISSDLDRAWSFPIGMGAYLPRMDTTDQGNNIKVTAEVPGIEEKDLDVIVNEDSITIRGDKKEETTQERCNKSAKILERSYGSFERSVGLPCKVQSDRAEAVLKNGVLTITVPKSQVAMNGGIKISIRKE